MNKIKLLVVDDEPLVFSFIKKVIEKENLPVASMHTAASGAEALKLAEAVEPDLVLMDIRIPEPDGLTAAQAILAARPQTDIIIISAYGYFEYARSAMKLGALDYLLKPIRPDELAACINSAAERLESASQPLPDPLKPELVTKAQNYIKENLSQHLTLGSIARAIYVSPYHLSRTFKQQTGQSIMNYIKDLRLAKAEKLLTSSRRTVTEIAESCGFDDPNYFATCFKAKYGLAPSEIRKAKPDRNIFEEDRKQLME